MRILFLALLLAITFSCGPSSSPDEPWSGGRWLDLTYSFDQETVYWPTGNGFQLDEVSRGVTAGGFFYAANEFAAAEHGGTHLDAPLHFHDGGWTAEEIPLQHLIGPAAVVDVSARALSNPDYQVQREDLEAWEREHGKLPEGVLLLLRTGFGKFWPDRVRYMGTDLRGAEAVAELHFPGLHPQTAQWLVDHRDVHAVGIDTPSLDHGQSKQFESHQILAAHNIPGLENLAHLDQLPARGALLVALPMKIRGGTGGPLRAVAYLP
jgi:kynurenine formamidase